MNESIETEGVSLGQGVRVGLGVDEAASGARLLSRLAAGLLWGVSEGIGRSVSPPNGSPELSELNGPLRVQAANKLIENSKRFRFLLRIVNWIMDFSRIGELSYRTWLGLPNQTLD